jgi:ABC-type phosphate transport system auxiliary subunit
MVDEDVVALGPSKRLESLSKGDDAGQDFGIVLGIRMQERDATHALALLTRREGRRDYCTG